jgi:hypothetical protein
MEPDLLVLRDGDGATAWGRLVRNEQGDWFEPLLPVAAIHIGDRGVRPVWSGAVRVAGADFDDLHGRIQRDGGVQGCATITGTWSGDHLQVQRQIPKGREPVRLPSWTVPPCPPPAGGWPERISISSPGTDPGITSSGCIQAGRGRRSGSGGGGGWGIESKKLMPVSLAPFPAICDCRPVLERNSTPPPSDP